MWIIKAIWKRLRNFPENFTQSSTEHYLINTHKILKTQFVEMFVVRNGKGGKNTLRIFQWHMKNDYMDHILSFLQAFNLVHSLCLVCICKRRLLSRFPAALIQIMLQKL